MTHSRPLQLESRPGCIKAAIDIMGDKWTPLILRDMSTCSQTFTDLESSLTLSPRTLSQRIDKLENEGIIEKSLYCEHPPRYAYSLTEKGLELLAILKAMAEWVEKYQANQQHR